MLTAAAALALLATALMLGGMAYFAAGVAPLIFTRLPAEWSGRFIRQVFPAYYLYVLGTAAVAGLALLPLRPLDALAMLLVAASTGWVRQWLMPAINAASDAAQAGDAAARARFRRGHGLSVAINLAQILVGLVVLLRFVV